MSPSSSVALSSVCVALAVIGLAASVPLEQQQQPPSQQPQPQPQQQQQQQQQRRQEDGAAGSAGFGAVVWSVLDDCFGGDADEPAAVCLKSKALTALDRALGKPALTVADGVTLTARAGKSLQAAVDPQAERADRAALDAAPDADAKSALLDDMLASRVDRLVSTRTIVLDGAGQEGRKKKDKAMQQAMMMAGMMAAAVMGPMAFKMLALIAGKALLLSKIALVLSGIIALKKLLQPQQGGHETESVSHHYGRSWSQLEAHDAAYSAQKPQ